MHERRSTAIERSAAHSMKALVVEAICDGALGRLIPNTAANTRTIDVEAQIVSESLRSGARVNGQTGSART